MVGKAESITCIFVFLSLFTISPTFVFATTIDNHAQIYNSDNGDTLLREQHHPTIADIENTNNIFKNSKVYQDYVKKVFETQTNDKQQRRRRRRTATVKPTTIDPAYIANIGKKYFSNVDTGGVISIAYKNNPKFCEGYGYANKEKKEPMTCNHLMQIASNSKAMASLLSLVASKKKAIDLDEPVRINFPLFNPTSHSTGANSADTLTMRDLLNHRTGMPRHDNLWQQPFSPRSGKMTRKQIIQTLPFLEMSRPQRIKAEYNNVMYTVAGVATANGFNILNQQQQQQQQNNEINGNDKLWEDYMETEIFQPFEMNQGTYPTLGRVPKSEMSKFATPYNKDEYEKDPNTGKQRPVASQTVMKMLDGDCVGPSMSVVSNGNDMYKYLYNLLHVLNPASSSYAGSPKIDIEIQELINPQNIYDYDYDTGFGPGQTYSFGWSKGVFHNTKIFHHGGAMYGYSSFILLIPSLEFGIFAIDNKYKGAANVVLAVREIITTLFFNDAKSSELHQRMLLESSQLTNENKDNGDNNDIGNMIYPRRKSRSRRRRGLSSSTTSPISLEKYVGTYRHPAYGVFTIKLNTAQNGLLYSRPLSSDLNFYELVFVRDHIFMPKLRPNTSFQYGKWLYFVDDPSGNIMFFLSQLANGKSTGANIAPIAFMKQGIKNELANKWLDQEFRKLPFQFPRDDL
jgi:CubicO group peptidase (beta-lactamase class C family)